MKKRKNWFGRVGVLVLVVIGLGALLLATDIGFGSSEEAPIEGAEVQRGPLLISVVERGNLKAADSVDLKSEVEGQTTVLWLIEEGLRVQPGDLLCELDTSDLVERRVTQEISVQNNEAAYIKARQNLEIQKSQNQSDIARAERQLEFARLDLTKYVEGDWPQELQQAEEAILLADEELTRAKQDLEWSVKLASNGFLEQAELDADRLAKTRAEIKLNQSRRAIELLREFEYPRQKSELDADVLEMERELERVKLTAAARLVDFEADERTTKARFDLEQEKLVKLDSQIEKATIRAPVAGMVVYSVESRGRWGGGEPMQEGAVVRERQGIITIPSAEGYIAEASLHESVLDKVAVGLPCIVTVDALPEKTLRGEVEFKAVLPDQNSWFANPDLRVYRTEISILENDPRIRPGMSCSIEILVDEIEDTLYVPVQSVFLDRGMTVCFVTDDGEVDKRSIEVGRNNGKWAAIEGGLEEGEVVCLSQPRGFILEPSEEAERAPGADAFTGGLEGRRPGGEAGQGGGEGRPGARGPGGPAAQRTPGQESEGRAPGQRPAQGQAQWSGGGERRPGQEGQRGSGAEGRPGQEAGSEGRRPRAGAPAESRPERPSEAAGAKTTPGVEAAPAPGSAEQRDVR